MPSPVDVIGVTNATEVFAGGDQSCARLDDATVVCWGTPVPLPDTTNGAILGTSTSPVSIPELDDVVHVAVGHDHACGVHADSTVSCWGKNESGQLGNTTLDERALPTAVEGVEGVIGITAGFSHTCVLLEGGTARCWGSALQGELGDGNAGVTPAGEVATVIELAGALEIRAGVSRTCARLPESRIFCWGNGLFGTLGDTAIDQSAAPIEIDGVVP
jgi:alpha-tubulin suppressor-like RCC1 family protein